MALLTSAFSTSSALSITGPGFKRLGPQYLPTSDSTRVVRGDFLPDLILPSWSQTITICNASVKSVNGAADPTEILFVTTSGPTPAEGELTFSGTGSDGDTVEIDGRTYTLKDALGVAADQVEIGATAAETATNLRNAINKNGLGGYSAATTINSSVWASVSGDVLTVTARVGGAAGNAFTTTELGADTSWGGATLAGGADDADVDSGIPVTLITPLSITYEGDAVPTLFVHCAQNISFTVLFHGGI